MKKLFFTIAFIAIAQFGNAQDSEFKKEVLKYLEVSGQSSNIRTALKEVSKGVPAEKQAAFTIELDAAIQDLMSKTADMYMTEFTQEEVKAFLKFYNTPAGKKLTSKSDVLTEKGQLVGKAWGEGLQSMMAKYMK
jgi:uncharacterized protein